MVSDQPWAIAILSKVETSVALETLGMNRANKIVRATVKLTVITFRQNVGMGHVEVRSHRFNFRAIAFIISKTRELLDFL